MGRALKTLAGDSLGACEMLAYYGSTALLLLLLLVTYSCCRSLAFSGVEAERLRFC